MDKIDLKKELKQPSRKYGKRSSSPVWRACACGKHHEIYLSDVQRAAPEKWKTIIRQPMA